MTGSCRVPHRREPVTMPSNSKSSGSGSRRSSLTSDEEPRREARAERRQEGRQTRSERTHEAPGASGNGRARGGAGSERARQARGTRDARSGPGMQGRNPSDEPDVFLDVPKVHVGDIYFDVEHLDAPCPCRPADPASSPEVAMSGSTSWRMTLKLYAATIGTGSGRASRPW